MVRGHNFQSIACVRIKSSQKFLSVQQNCRGLRKDFCFRNNKVYLRMGDSKKYISGSVTWHQLLELRSHVGQYNDCVFLHQRSILERKLVAQNEYWRVKQPMSHIFVAIAPTLTIRVLFCGNQELKVNNINESQDLIH